MEKKEEEKRKTRTLTFCENDCCLELQLSSDLALHDDFFTCSSVVLKKRRNFEKVKRLHHVISCVHARINVEGDDVNTINTSIKLSFHPFFMKFLWYFQPPSEKLPSIFQWKTL